MNIEQKIGLPKNSDYLLFNTIYHKRTNDDGVNDSIDLILKNINTNEKIIKRIDNPDMEIYMAKPDVELGDYVHIDIAKEDVDLIDVPYSRLIPEMYKLIGQEKYYWDCIRQRRFDDAKRIFEYNRFFSADRNIEDFYRYKCLKHFGMKPLNNTTKGFLDIEADIVKGDINFDTGTGTAPINAISFADGNTKTVYTVLLRDPDNPQIAEVEANISELIEKAHEMNDDIFGVMEYKIAFFDNEIDLIITIFQLLNIIKLDFVLIWNIAFDIPYMIDRLKKAGIDPADVMCHPDFYYKECTFVPDKRNYEIKKKTDHFICSSYSQFMDQMINYASIRKGKAELDKYTLDFIAKKEKIGAGKIDYSNESSFKNLAYTNYELFVLYSIRDVLVQYGIENKTNDIDTIFFRAYESNTRYNKIFKEITFLTNVAFKEFELEGVILGNNINAIRANRKDDENVIVEEDVEGNKKFKGAVVGDPLLIMKNGLVLVGKEKSRSVFNIVVDYDFTSLYPSIIKLFNIYKSTLIGKIVMDNSKFNKEEIRARDTDDTYDRGAKFIEDLETKEPIFICNRWMGLPSFENLVEIVANQISDDEKYKVLKIKKKSSVTNKDKKKKVLKIKKKNILIKII